VQQLAGHAVQVVVLLLWASTTGAGVLGTYLAGVPAIAGLSPENVAKEVRCAAARAGGGLAGATGRGACAAPALRRAAGAAALRVVPGAGAPLGPQVPAARAAAWRLPAAGPGRTSTRRRAPRSPGT
jgi:hypothetical protein